MNFIKIVFKKLHSLIMKQYIIDSGQLGGLFQLTFTVLGLLGIITFMNTLIVSYQTFWKYYFSIYELIIIILFLFGFGLWVLHAILQPSSSQYIARQSYSLHNNPMQKDINEIKNSIKEIKKQLK